MTMPLRLKEFEAELAKKPETSLNIGDMKNIMNVQAKYEENKKSAMDSVQNAILSTVNIDDSKS